MQYVLTKNNKITGFIVSSTTHLNLKLKVILKALRVTVTVAALNFKKNKS